MKERGRYVVIAADEYPAIDQACVLNSSKNKDSAQQFLSYIKSASVGELLANYGFDVSGRTPR